MGSHVSAAGEFMLLSHYCCSELCIALYFIARGSGYVFSFFVITEILMQLLCFFLLTLEKQSHFSLCFISVISVHRCKECLPYGDILIMIHSMVCDKVRIVVPSYNTVRCMKERNKKSLNFIDVARLLQSYYSLPPAHDG